VNRRLAELRARRELQRDALALLVERWHAPLDLADRGFRVVQYAREHPGAILLAVAVLVALSPKRAFRWAGRATAIWRGSRWAVAAIRRLVA
jgi:hypothetical protein